MSDDETRPVREQRSSLIGDLLRPITVRGGAAFAAKVRSLGVRGTAREVARVLRNSLGMLLARAYDRHHRVNTSGMIRAEDYDGPDGNHGYLPISSRSLRGILRRLRTDLSRYSFVDYGCGKGRAVLTAAGLPFRAVIGVEYASTLAAIAQRNLTTWRNGALRCPDVRIVNADARAFEPPPGPCLLFFYSPFLPEVLQAVLERIGQSYRATPRPMLVVYAEDRDSPVAIPTALFETAGFLSRRPAPRLPLDLSAPRLVDYVVYGTPEVDLPPA
jgi:SAM-dependent methyltransferase